MLQILQQFFASIIAFLLGLFGSGCSPSLPSYLNLSYGASSSQVMDLYLPDEPENIDGPVNAVLYIHGGGYDDLIGDKSNYKADCKARANEGLVAATINYRLLQEGATFDSAMDDVASALEFLKNKAESLGFSINKVAIQGISAGGHLALMYSYTHYADSPIPIAFCVGQVPRTNLLDIHANLLLGDVFGRMTKLAQVPGQLTEANLEEYRAYLEPYSPLYLANADVPPTILCMGLKDPFIPYTNGTDLDARLEKLGVAHIMLTYPNSGHFLDNDPDIESQFQLMFKQYISEYM